jgi:hypothetical protein
MNRFTVIWDEDVEADFVNRWLESDSPARAALTKLANRIDSALAVDADTLGEPQESEIGTRAVVLKLPSQEIAVYFKPSVEDRTVRVTALVIHFGIR